MVTSITYARHPASAVTAVVFRTIAACVIAQNVGEHIGQVVQSIRTLVKDGSIQQLVVIDGGSVDSTAEIAASLGAEVLLAPSLLPEYGEVLGKGDTLWRGASVIESEIIVCIDGDIVGDHARIVRSLAGPLTAEDRRVRFVKGYFRRVASAEDLALPKEAMSFLPGGRVTESVARPLIRAIAPELAVYREPLCGQIAIDRDVLRTLPIVTGYGLEIGMLFDVVASWGHDAILQVDLGEIYNPPQPESALEGMSDDVVGTLTSRVCGHASFMAPASASTSVLREPPPQRPPLNSLSDEGSAGSGH